MNTFESLVPPLALCKEAAALIGNETALVWFMWERKSGDVYGNLVPREMKDEFAGVLPPLMAVLRKDVPAPTLPELLDLLSHAGASCYALQVGGNLHFAIRATGDSHEESDANPATAALRLLMRLEAGKC